ncbi:MAG: DNA polymerase III subunit beta, partial [Candidatus Pelagibacter ubique]|nr:DNA polymerase III subunit beta [Candidatus Pelagibacter ubique]
CIIKKMKFNVNQQDLQQALNYCQGVIEKRSTLPILSNVLLNASNSNLTITATDLDLIFIHQINNVEVIEEGNTTTTSSIMYDIIRKFSSGKKINLSLTDVSKLQVESEKSVFNLNCISASEFPLTDENFNQNEFSIKSKQLLKLLNKCKFSVSNDETRHYLSGIFFHQTQTEDKNFLTAAATDSHRMSISKIRLDQQVDFEPIILPKKTIFQLCSLLESYDGDVKISNIKSKIKFELNNSILISKLIDGKFPNYIQVIPKNNQKKLEIDLKLFLDSVDRVASVSLDKKDGVKFNLSKDVLNLSVNNTNSGDGKESLTVKFDHDLEISFNSRYLIDVAAQLDGDKIEIFFNDTGSPALIKDPGDFDSIFVVMPMKG